MSSSSSDSTAAIDWPAIRPLLVRILISYTQVFTHVLFVKPGPNGGLAEVQYR